MRCVAIRRRLPRGPVLERAAAAVTWFAVAALPFDDGPTLLFTGSFTIAVVLAALRGVRTRRAPFARTGLEWPVLLFAAFAIASLAWAELPRDTRNLLWRDLLRGVGMFWLVATHARGRIPAFAGAFAVGVSVCAAVALVQRALHAGVDRYRVFGTFDHPNHCADWMLVGVMLVAALPIRRVGVRIAFALPILATLFFTLSRGAWVAALVAIAVFGAMRSRRALVIGAVLVVAVAATAWLAPAGYVGDRVRDMVTPERFVRSLHHRPEIWAGARAMVFERPWLGHGYGYKNFHPAWERRPSRPDALYNSAHNTPLEIAFELGVIGLGLAAWIWLVVAWRLVATARGGGGAIAVAVLAVFVGWSLLGLTIEHVLLEQMMPIIGAWIGFGFAIARIER